MQDVSNETLCLIELPQGYGMIPLTDEVRKRLKLLFCPLTDGDENLPAELIGLCVAISQKAQAAYVEAEFFGGNGMQASVVFNGDENSGSLIIDGHAINEALAEIGVQRFDHVDEFVALGLNKHRDTEDWLLK